MTMLKSVDQQIKHLEKELEHARKQRAALIDKRLKQIEREILLVFDNMVKDPSEKFVVRCCKQVQTLKKQMDSLHVKKGAPLKMSSLLKKQLRRFNRILAANR